MSAQPPDDPSASADGAEGTFGAHQARAAAMAIAPGVLLAGVGGGMAFPILPIVGLRAGLSLAFIGVILAANRFARVIFNPFVGAAVDRGGGKRVLIVGLLLQTVVLALYVAGVRTGHPGAFFLVGRLLHGPASSCVFVAGQTLALHAGGRAHKGLASGIVRSAMSSGMPLGLVAGGLLAGWLGADTAFAIAAIAPLMAAWVASRNVPDLRAPGEGRVPSFREVLASLLHREVAAIAAINFVTTFCALGLILAAMIPVIQMRKIRVFHWSDQTSAGIFMGALVASMVIVAPFAGRLSDRQGWRAHLVAAGLFAMMLGVVCIGIAKMASTLALGLGFIGMGMGALTRPLLALLGDLVPSSMRGSAVGCLQLFGDAGGTLGPIVGTSLLARLGPWPFFGTAGLLALLLPFCFWLARAERTHPHVAAPPA